MDYPDCKGLFWLSEECRLMSWNVVKVADLMGFLDVVGHYTEC